jgi:hypothetical protein
MVMQFQKSIRIYADTSVFGGIFDKEFEAPSKVFFDAVRKSRFSLVTSELVRQEIEAAPIKVRNFFFEILPTSEIAEVTEDTFRLQKAYLDADILSEKYSTDALHVALATVSQASLIVSWNFKHIVNFQKIPLYNAVNTLRGYNEIAIYSPMEVIEYED